MANSSVNGDAASDRSTPISLAQQAALLPERLRGVPAANLFIALEVTGEFDGEAFEQAAAAVFAEHEILRSIFPDDRRMPYQRVTPVPDTVVEAARIDVTALEPALRADAAHRFDAVRRPPVRIRRYELDDRAVVSIATHPVAADDRTLELLVSELFVAYELGTAQPAALQYRSHVAAQLKSLGAVDDHGLVYWADRLATLPGPLVAVDGEAGGPEQCSFTLSAETVTALSAQKDVVVVLAAALAAALRDAGPGPTIPVGLVDASRIGADDATALGNFANYIVLQLDSVDSDAAPGVQIDAADRLLADARAHASTRIEQVTHQVKGAAAVTAGALFPVTLNVRPRHRVIAEGLSVREIARNVARPQGVDLVVDVVVDDAGATVTLDNAGKLGAAAEFAEHLANKCRAWAQGRDDRDAPTLFAAPHDHSGPGLGGPPQGDAETIVAEAVRKVLDFDADDEIGREDTFFALGGDSIAALRLVTALAEQGYALDVQTVFGHPAIRELALQLNISGPTGAAADVAPMAASGLDAATLAALGEKFRTP